MVHSNNYCLIDCLIDICITRILAQKRKAAFPSIRLPSCRRRPRRRSSTGIGHNLQRFSNAFGRFYGQGAPSLLPDSTVFNWLPFLSRRRQVFEHNFIIPSSLDQDLCRRREQWEVADPGWAFHCTCISS